MTHLHDFIKRPKRRNRHKAMTQLERWMKEQKRKGIYPPRTKIKWEGNT